MIFVLIFLAPIFFTVIKLKTPKPKKLYLGRHRRARGQTCPILEKYQLDWSAQTELLQKRLVDKAAEDGMMEVYKSPKEVRHDRRKDLWRQTSST
jgi:hypothetical protein